MSRGVPPLPPDFRPNKSTPQTRKKHRKDFRQRCAECGAPKPDRVCRQCGSTISSREKFRR